MGRGLGTSTARRGLRWARVIFGGLHPLILSTWVLREEEQGGQRCDELPVLCAHVSVRPSVHPSIRPSIPKAAVTQPAVTHHRGGDQGPRGGRPGGESAAPGAAPGRAVRRQRGAEVLHSLSPCQG